MNSFEYTSALQYKVKSQAQQIAEFKSGIRYLKLEEKYKRIIRELEEIIRELKQELARAHKETRTVRDKWSEIADDLYQEHHKDLAGKERLIKKFRKEKLELIRQRDAALSKCRDMRQEFYRVGAELEEERGLNQKLTAQVNMNFENSSFPHPNKNPAEKSFRTAGSGPEGNRVASPGMPDTAGNSIQ